MRIHRFYIAEAVGAKTEVMIRSVDLVNQIRRVFRLKMGDSVILFDGSGSDFTCRIEEMGKVDVTFAVSSVSKSHYMPSREVVLCAAVVKKDTFEWIVEKATELGVTKIIPIIAERSEKKNLNEERLKKIAIEASEQSGRGSVPEILPIIGLNELVCVTPAKAVVQGQATESEIQKMAFHLEGNTFDERARSDLAKRSPLCVFIGPEGGWSPDELELFHKNEIHIYSLGNQVLRAETAVVAALSQVLLG